MSLRLGAASTEALNRSLRSMPISEPSTSWDGMRWLLFDPSVAVWEDGTT